MAFSLFSYEILEYTQKIDSNHLTHTQVCFCWVEFIFSLLRDDKDIITHFLLLHYFKINDNKAVSSSGAVP